MFYELLLLQFSLILGSFVLCNYFCFLGEAGWSHFAQFTIAVVNKDPKKSKYSGLYYID